jgi:hypothetical protein
VFVYTLVFAVCRVPKWHCRRCAGWRLITQRGNGRACTFFDDADYALYRDLLAEHCRAADRGLGVVSD